MRYVFLLIAMLLLAACATVPLPENRALLVEGTVQVVRPTFTGWVRDWCVDGKPVLLDQQYGDDDCMPIGGEIYRADLFYGRIVGVGRIKSRMRVALPGHAYPAGYTIRSQFVLLPSPKDFRSAVGIPYIIGDSGGYDAAQECIVDLGYSHVGERICKDRSYHERNFKQCVPLPEYLAHYSPSE